MGRDFEKLDAYPAEDGSLLDMAFVDRGALWDQRRKQAGCDVQIEGMDGGYGFTYS